MADNPHDHPPSGGGGYGHWVFWGFLLIAGFFLVAEHRAHLYPYLPFVLLLVSLLLHLFHGHGGHAKHGKETDKDRTR
jgi:hypothetical protein